MIRFATPSGRPPKAFLVAPVAVMILAAASGPVLNLRELDLPQALADLWEFAGCLLQWPDAAYLPTLGLALAQTLAITVVASFLTIGASLPIALLAATNTSPHRLVSLAVRAALALIRSLPDLVWAMLFVSALSQGPLPGILALTVVGIGLLGRLYAEAFEVVDERCVEALEAQGASRLQVQSLAVVPQAMPDLVGQSVYILDHNLRSAAILGLVGAGGLGYELFINLRLFNYPRVTANIIAVFLVVALFDRCSEALRRRVI